MTDDENNHGLAAVPIPALLRWARHAYAHAVRAELANAGCDDLPRNGAHVIGGLVNQHEELANLLRGLQVTKQAASQLLDTMVLRGYLTRSADPTDRRRLVVEPTERGRQAADAVRTGVAAIDAELAQRLSAEQVAGLRAALFALGSIGEQRGERSGS